VLLRARTSSTLLERPDIEGARDEGHEQDVRNGECRALTGGVTPAGVDDDVLVLLRKAQRLGAQRGTRELDAGVAGVSLASLVAKHGEVKRGLLIVRIDEEHVGARACTHDGKIRRDGGLARPALDAVAHHDHEVTPTSD
jgi:hypothetical protein